MGAALDSTHNDLNCTTVLVGPFEAGIAAEKSGWPDYIFLQDCFPDARDVHSSLVRLSSPFGCTGSEILFLSTVQESRLLSAG